MKKELVKKKNILIDGRVLSHQSVTGVERYSLEIIKGISNLLPKDIDITKPSSKNRYIQHFWEHTYLPYKSKKYKLLFCPANICPIIKPKGVKFITTIHDVSFLNYPESFSYKYRSYYKLITKMVVSISDAIITVSEFEKNELISRYNISSKKISSIHSGVSSEFLNCNISFKKDNYILYVGNLSKRKNFKGLIEAFAKIYKKIDKKLVIVGTKPEIMKLDKDIENIILDIPKKYIEFMGQINNKSQLAALYRKAYAFIFPSFYESFGFPVLEAMACGCPVIASNRGALPEICKDAVLYVDPLNRDDICDKIYFVVENESLRSELVEKGKERALFFSWDKSIKEHTKLLQSFL